MISRSLRLRVAVGVLAVLTALGAAPLVGTANALPPTEDFCEGVPDESPFVDVPDSDDPNSDPAVDNAPNILCLAESEITVGTDPAQTMYSPSAFVSRRQMALFIKRLIDTANELEITDLQELPAYDGSPDFSDIGDEEPNVQEAIGQLSQAEVIGGFTDGTYRPTDQVLRDQMARFIVGALEYLLDADLPEGEDAFTDDDDGVFNEFINKLANAEIVVGTASGDYNPRFGVQRRPMASFLIRSLAALFESGDISALLADPGTDAGINLDATTVDQGGTITGSVDNPDDVASITVDGCGLEDQDVTFDEDGEFSFALPADQDEDCTLTFTVTFDDGTTATQAVAITIEVPAGNEFNVIEVTPTEDVTIEFTPNPEDGSDDGDPDDDREYMATGLDADQEYRVTLVDSDNISGSDEDPMFEEDGDTGLADAGMLESQLTEVNNDDVDPPAQSVGGIEPVGTTITFTVDADGPETLTPVVYVDEGGTPMDNPDTRLNIDDEGRPTEPFGLGGEIEAVPAEAEDGTDATVTVTDVDEEEDQFVGFEAGDPMATPPTEDGPSALYLYDANDDFSVEGEQATLAEFELELSKADVVEVTDYQTDPELESTFDIVTNTPTPPEVMQEVAEDDVTITVTPTVPDFDTLDDFDSYTIERAEVTSGSLDPLTGGCTELDLQENPVEEGDFELVVTETKGEAEANGNVSEDGMSFEFTDEDVPPGCYLYRATVTVDDDESEPASFEQTPATGPTPVEVGEPGDADTEDPTIEDLRIDDADSDGDVSSGDIIAFLFSEAMADEITEGSFRFTEGGQTFEVDCATGGEATCVLDDADADGNPLTMEADNALLVTLTDDPQVTSGTGDDVADLPGELVSVSAEFTDVAGNPVDLANSPDTMIDNETSASPLDDLLDMLPPP